MMAQYQPNRAKLRRKPQAMMGVKQRPKEGDFNFSKVGSRRVRKSRSRGFNFKVDEERELLFKLSNKDRKGEGRNLLLINVSPIGQLEEEQRKKEIEKREKGLVQGDS